MDNMFRKLPRYCIDICDGGLRIMKIEHLTPSTEDQIEDLLHFCVYPCRTDETEV